MYIKKQQQWPWKKETQGILSNWFTTYHYLKGCPLWAPSCVKECTFFHEPWTSREQDPTLWRKTTINDQQQQQQQQQEEEQEQEQEQEQVPMASMLSNGSRLLTNDALQSD